MVELGKVYDATFTDLTHDAMGVAKIDGYPLFVEGALKGERALIKVTKTNKNFGFAKLLEIKEVSPFRKEPLCGHYDNCGGCNLMHMHYDIQLDFKRHRVKETLRKIGRVDMDVSPTVGMDNPFYYRNKAMIPFGEKDGKIVAGMFKKGSHEIIDLNRCHIYPRGYSEIVKAIKQFLSKESIEIYNPHTDKGIVRGIMLRRSEAYDSISLVVITATSKFPGKDQFVAQITQRFANITSVILNVNAHDKNFRLGNKSKVLYGEDKLEERLLGVSFEMSHQSFFQINPSQSEVLFKKVGGLIGEKDTTLLDAYCGTGSISLALSQYVEKVIGFDISKHAIKNAQANARKNGIEHASFIVGAADKVMPSLKDSGIDVVVVDPPRKGLDKSFLETLMRMNVPKIIYISCNVSTFARDAKTMREKGYDLKQITPVDMFPQTSHVETVALLERG